jgi:peptidyl-prolyl cis-trans isomerase D
MVAEIRAGKAFEDAASERGLAVESAGPFTRMGFNPAFGQANAVTGAAFGLPLGQVSDVLTTPAGHYIIRPTARTPADRAQFDTRKEELRQIALFQLQQEALARWMQDLRAEANIVDRREDLQRLAATAPPLVQ